MNILEKDLVLSLLIGDGYISKEGRLAIEHSIKQETYLLWKCQLIEEKFNKHLNIYFRKDKNTKAIYLDRKSIFLPIRELIYTNKHKSIPKILNLIDNKTFLLALWMADDAAINRAGIKLCVCDSTEDELKEIQLWFQKNFQLNSFIRYEKHKDKIYPFLIFHEFESMVIWSIIRNYLHEIPFIRHKFRNIISKYNLKYSNLEHNLPTKPRIPKILTRENLKISDQSIIEKYQEINSIKRLAKFYNTSESVIKEILNKNQSTHKRGHRKGNMR